MGFAAWSPVKIVVRGITMRNPFVVTTTVALALAVLGAPSATAIEEQTYGIVSIHANNIRVGTGSCIQTPLKVTYSNIPGSDHSWSADVDVWNGSQYVGNEFVWDPNTPITDSPTITVNDSLQWCSMDGFGTFRLGASQVDADNWDTMTNYAFSDNTTGTFVVKQDARAAFTARRSSSRRRLVNLSASVTYFNDDWARWMSWTGRTVIFQRHTADGWVTVAKRRDQLLRRCDRADSIVEGRYLQDGRARELEHLGRDLEDRESAPRLSGAVAHKRKLMYPV